MKRSTLRIPNLRTSADKIHSFIYWFAFSRISNNELKSTEYEVSDLHAQILSLLSIINKHCTGKLGSPADLSTSSFRIYLWLEYLSSQTHLALHLSALDEFLRILTEQNKKTNIDPEKLLIKINYSGYLYRRQITVGKTTLQINEAYSIAPLEIKKSILSEAFSRHQSKHTSAIKAFSKSSNFQRLNRQISGDPIANLISCRGEKYNLALLFEKLNHEYFRGLLSQPRLVWSSRRSKRRLGYYHPEINTIAVTKKLDDKKTPRLLVEYVLYHEMLHQHFGIKNHNGRRYAHTSAFRTAERKFKHHQEAENLIKLLH